MKHWEELSEQEKVAVDPHALLRELNRNTGERFQFSLERHPGRPGKPGRPFVRLRERLARRQDYQERTWWGDSEQEAVYKAAFEVLNR